MAPPVREPLDARGIGPCDLLKADQLRELGLHPESAKVGKAGIADTCSWSSTDPGNAGALQLSIDPTLPVLDGVYLIRDSFVVFEPTQVAGHPAVRADQTVEGGCVLYTAIADYQGIAASADIAGRKSADPCATSRRMTELILSNLLPLR